MKTNTNLPTSTTPLLGTLPKDSNARLKKAADEFEAIWTERLMKESRPKSTLFGKSFASETFHDMQDQALARTMAQRGALGLSKALTKQLAPKQGTSKP
ncbi:MAG: rod-binding protein [Planctomycetota bacterium]